MIARIASMELAAKMQLRAAEVTDFSTETKATKESYGINDGNMVKAGFARNCLLARRLLERDVRFVQRGRVNHRLNAVFPKGALNERPIGDGATDARIRARRHIEADHDMTGGAKARREEPAEPARRSRQKNSQGPPSPDAGLTK